MKNRFVAFFLFLILASATPVFLQAGGNDWDSPNFWSVITEPYSDMSLRAQPGIDGLRLEIKYQFTGFGEHYAYMEKEWTDGDWNNRPLSFLIQSTTTATLEIRLTDEEGSVFYQRFPLGPKTAQWNRVVVYKDTFLYNGGIAKKMGPLKTITLALLGENTAGFVLIDELGLDSENRPPTLVSLSPDKSQAATSPGYGTLRLIKSR